MKIVVLDGAQASQDDINFDCFMDYGEVVVYSETEPHQLEERIFDADILVTNRVFLYREQIDLAKNLKLIATFSTGFNQVDIDYAKEKGIIVSNCPGYSSFAIAQGTMALLLEVCNKTSQYDKFVRDGMWTSNACKELWDIKPIELRDKTMGIIGYGNIGESVANMAKAFGMKILAYKRTPDHSIECENFRFVSMEELYQNSDVISLHCALNDQTRHMINSQTISQMKDGVIIVNTARGPLVNESDICDAINRNKILAYATDVPYNEPILSTDAIFSCKNTVVMPHVTWIAKDTRLRLLNMVSTNIKNFLDGNPSNVVNK